MDPSLGTDLCTTILYVLNFHQGKANAIARAELLHQLKAHGCKNLDERVMRQAIHDLRTVDRELICSAGGPRGGYYYPANWAELNEYLEREVRPRALDLLEQEKILRGEAERIWGVEQFALPLTLPEPRRQAVMNG